MVDTSQTAQRYLGDYLDIESPIRFFVVGQLPEGIFRQPGEGVDVEYVLNLSEAEAAAAKYRVGNPAQRASPLALLMQVNIDDQQTRQLLGRAVLAFPHRVLVHCQVQVTSAHIVDELFFSLGFRRLSVLHDMDDPLQGSSWFEYRLSQYKGAPEWLNARFWANPERFAMDEDVDEYHEHDDHDDEQ